jgi:hypothetical protein
MRALYACLMGDRVHGVSASTGLTMGERQQRRPRRAPQASVPGGGHDRPSGPGALGAAPRPPAQGRDFGSSAKVSATQSLM